MMIGLHIMRPSTIVVAGGGTETASIRSDGGVEFANATSLSLNGVFTADYDNYMISVRFTGTTNIALRYRLRLSGTDASGADYARQLLSADDTSVTGFRNTGETSSRISNTYNARRSGVAVYAYGPNLAQPTAIRSVSVSDLNNAFIVDYASTHSLSTAYDGYTVYPDTGSITGLITVMGYAQ